MQRRKFLASLFLPAFLTGSKALSGGQHVGITSFADSQLIWKTKTGSYGYWQLACVASRFSVSGEIMKQYVLTDVVMAGNVYSTDFLPKEPAYSFQMIASLTDHYIIRLPSIAGAHPHIVSSSGQNINKFELLDIDLVRNGRDPIPINTLTPEIVRASWPITAQVEISGPHSQHWRLEFPVRHINVAEANGEAKFQIETGPILIPADALPTEGVSRHLELAIGYIFINRPDRADFSVWGPHDQKITTLGFFHRIRLPLSRIGLFSEALRARR